MKLNDDKALQRSVQSPWCVIIVQFLDMDFGTRVPITHYTEFSVLQSYVAYKTSMECFARISGITFIYCTKRDIVFP